MRIGILTVPFNNNYGGFLQAYALTQILERKGHEVTIINRRRNRASLWNRTKASVKYLIGRYPTFELLSEYHNKRIGKYTRKFVKRYLNLTRPIYSSPKLSKFNFDYYIVGSDQVWRYKFCPSNIDDYFFSFLQDDSKPRISYAASFGTEEMEYDDAKRILCARLIQKFKSISVRERSGVEVLSKYFNVPSSMVKVVLDPTMLLSTLDYTKLLMPYVKGDDKYVYTYILDEDEDKARVRQEIVKCLGCDYKEGKAQTGPISKQNVLEPIESWLASIYAAEFVLTDSFHGTVFSILFNKPFIVYGNIARGKARFDHLLSSFGLEERYIASSKDLTDTLIKKRINWEHVNELLEEYRSSSMQYLCDALTNGK